MFIRILLDSNLLIRLNATYTALLAITQGRKGY